MLSEPIPYHAALCRVLGGVTISIVLVYLEIHHSPQDLDPDAQPARAGLRTPPVSLDCDQACQDLGVSRRTLHTALESLGVWWRTEQQRSGAARSGRDFIHSGRSFPASTHTIVRPYAIVGSRKHNQPRTLVIHRNQTRLNQILVDAGLLECRNWAANSDTCVSTSVADSPSDVLENVLGLGAVKRGIAWGWSQKRVLEHSERMTRIWAERREKASKWVKTAS
jgi:hypothetical protein